MRNIVSSRREIQLKTSEKYTWQYQLWNTICSICRTLRKRITSEKERSSLPSVSIPLKSCTSSCLSWYNISKRVIQVFLKFCSSFTQNLLKFCSSFKPLHFQPDPSWPLFLTTGFCLHCDGWKTVSSPINRIAPFVDTSPNNRTIPTSLSWQDLQIPKDLPFNYTDMILRLIELQPDMTRSQ